MLLVLGLFNAQYCCGNCRLQDVAVSVASIATWRLGLLLPACPYALLALAVWGVVWTEFTVDEVAFDLHRDVSMSVCRERKLDLFIGLSKPCQIARAHRSKS